MKKEQDIGVKEYEIPTLGSLGLLALGDVGLKMWREKRDIEAARQKKKSGNSKKLITDHYSSLLYVSLERKPG